MSDLTDRLRLAIQSIDMHDDNEDAILEAAAVLDALDDLLITASRGPISDPDYSWLLDSAYRILHPEDDL